MGELQKMLKKLKENDFKVFKIIEREQLEIIDAENFENAQDGFRFNSFINEPIDDWKTMVGENFYVIGNECFLGDVIIADVGTEGFPVYFMMHDDWESLEKVANSFDKFIDNLKAMDKIINVEHQDRETIKKFVEKLDEENDTNGFYELICFDILDKDGFYFEDFKEKR